jgi:hypothetical protein
MTTASATNLDLAQPNLDTLALGATAASRKLPVVKMRKWRELKKPKAVQAEFLWVFNVEQA